MTARPLSTVLARLIGLCIAPIALIAAWLAWRDLRAQDANQLHSATQLARSVSTGLDQLMAERIRSLDMLARSRRVDDPRRWPELYEDARSFRASFDSHVIFADGQGRALFHTRLPYGSELPRLPSSTGRDAARLAVDSGRPQVGDLVVGPVLGPPVVALVAGRQTRPRNCREPAPGPAGTTGTRRRRIRADVGTGRPRAVPAPPGPQPLTQPPASGNTWPTKQAAASLHR